MKIRLPSGSLILRRLDGRWQWLVLLSLLGYLNTAQNITDIFKCYNFRIIPPLRHMDVNDQLRPEAFTIEGAVGTVSESHVCNPTNTATITVDLKSGKISVQPDPDKKGVAGRCTITAVDTDSKGEQVKAHAELVVRKSPLVLGIFSLRTENYVSALNTYTMYVGQIGGANIYVAGGRKPYFIEQNSAPSVFSNSEISEMGGNSSFWLSALKKGYGTISVRDSGTGEDTDRATLTIKVLDIPNQTESASPRR